MQADTRPTPSARFQSLAALTGLLERLERQPGSASAEQYRGLVRQISALLAEAEAEPDAPLGALLDASPALATLYENLHYAHAGLCRTPLDRGLQAEMMARDIIRKASQPA